MHSIQESDALLFYKVGPVTVCSPTMQVMGVVIPPVLNAPPGSSAAEPGVFKSLYGLVRVVDLRVRFGVDKEDYKSPGRIIIVEVEGGLAGFLVDVIQDVTSFPEKGWSQVPSHIPRQVFSRTLLEKENIRLYADFEALDAFRATGYLRAHIEKVKQQNIKEKQKVAEPVNKTPVKISRPDGSVNNDRADKIEVKPTGVNAVNTPSDKPAVSAAKSTATHSGSKLSSPKEKALPYKAPVVNKSHVGRVAAEQVPDAINPSKIKAPESFQNKVTGKRPSTEDKMEVGSSLSVLPSLASRAAIETRSPKINNQIRQVDENGEQSTVIYWLVAIILVALLVYVVPGFFDEKDVLQATSKPLPRKARVYPKDDMALEVMETQVQSQAQKETEKESSSVMSEIPQEEESGNVEIISQDEGIVIVVNNYEDDIADDIENEATASVKHDDVKEWDGGEADEINYAADSSVKDNSRKNIKFHIGNKEELKTGSGQMLPKSFEDSYNPRLEGSVHLSDESKNEWSGADEKHKGENIGAYNVKPIKINNPLQIMDSVEKTSSDKVTEKLSDNRETESKNTIIFEEKLKQADVEMDTKQADIRNLEPKDEKVKIIGNIKEEVAPIEAVTVKSSTIKPDIVKPATAKPKIVKIVTKEMVVEKIDIEKTTVVEQKRKPEIIKKPQKINQSLNKTAITKQSPDKKTLVIQASKEKIQKEQTIKKPAKTKQLADTQSPKTEKTQRHIHIVVKGDTLWHIAKRYVNNPWRYPELARLSRIRNPDLIYPGQKIIIILNYKQD